MNFNSHSGLAGKHALLSPSNYHWINYDDQKLEARFIAAMAAKRGTDLHEFAHTAIQLGIRLPNTPATINQYVNDAIGYKMTVEQPLFYSMNCFGHADAIAFRSMLLRVHDLKTGVGPTSEHQLEVYTALFCLEYEVSPFDIGMELRIYQSNEVRVFEPTPDDILHIMDKIITFDKRIEMMKEEDKW